MRSVVKFTFVLVTTLFLILSLEAFSPTARAATDGVSTSSNTLTGIASGSAYAGFLKVSAGSSIASVGPLFPTRLGCALSNHTMSASGASINLGGFVSSGSLADTTTTSRTSGSVTVKASSSVQNVSLLSGLITATAINTVASSTADSSTASSSNSSTFVGLALAGVPIFDTPAPNTTISLPALGSVTLNEQVGPSNSSNATGISVTAIDIKVTVNNIFGLSVGTRILIAHAQTSFNRTAMPAAVSANAYALYVLVKAGSGSVSSGPWSLAEIGCTGGDTSVSLAGVSVPGIASTGTISDTAFGKITSSSANANSSSAIEEVNLLNGLITADTAKTTALASSNGTASATTTLLNATVDGISLSANPHPNTVMTIAGLGYIVLNEQFISITSTGASARVNALDIFVTTSNAFGLPVGAQVIVGHANASVATE
ncbi:MAG TPA: choice-of-anchor P family protein [Ktedonosporobacter sp.]|nr:choice-of-anchor P family protein [Ktedonosporobacter sp.]